MTMHRLLARAAVLATLLLATFVLGLETAVMAAEPIVLTEADSGSAVALARDQPLEIRLPTQSGAGFSWGAVGLGGMRLWSGEVEEGAAEPGGAEMQVFRFQPIAAGSGEIVLDYRQPWQSGQPPERTFTVTVTVAE